MRWRAEDSLLVRVARLCHVRAALGERGAARGAHGGQRAPPHRIGIVAYAGAGHARVAPGRVRLELRVGAVASVDWWLAGLRVPRGGLHLATRPRASSSCRATWKARWRRYWDPRFPQSSPTISRPRGHRHPRAPGNPALALAVPAHPSTTWQLGRAENELLSWRTARIRLSNAGECSAAAIGDLSPRHVESRTRRGAFVPAAACAARHPAVALIPPDPQRHVA